MSSIRSKNTKLDSTMSKLLADSGLRATMYPKIYGNPDFLLHPKIAVFCDSAFWHGRNWAELKKKLEQGNNSEYWINHIAKNMARDRLVTRRLRKEGYRVLRFWDSDIYKKPDLCIAKIRKELDFD